MLSKNKLKYLRSLALKKYRDAEGVFLAEGPKVVADLLPHLHCTLLCATPEWLSKQKNLSADEIIEITERELCQASQLRTPREVIAVFALPTPLDLEPLHRTTQEDFVLALDGVQDPGNLGTIIRLADWFGICHLVCSPDTADAYAPKVVQATMGALARVRLHYTELPKFLQSLPNNTPIMGTHLDGDNLYQQALPANGVLLMGNEGKGISPEVETCVTARLFIPNYPMGSSTSESLNVAIATALVCGELRRRAHAGN